MRDIYCINILVQKFWSWCFNLKCRALMLILDSLEIYFIWFQSPVWSFSFGHILRRRRKCNFDLSRILYLYWLQFWTKYVEEKLSFVKNYIILQFLLMLMLMAMMMMMVMMVQMMVNMMMLMMMILWARMLKKRSDSDLHLSRLSP